MSLLAYFQDLCHEVYTQTDCQNCTDEILRHWTKDTQITSQRWMQESAQEAYSVFLIIVWASLLCTLEVPGFLSSFNLTETESNILVSIPLSLIVYAGASPKPQNSHRLYTVRHWQKCILVDAH